MAGDLAGLGPARLTTERTFSAADHVTVMTRAFQGRGKAAAPVQITARIVDTQDRTASNTEATLAPAAFGTDRHADYRLDLPLDHLSPGDYLLTLEAHAGAVSVRRDLRFAVR